MDGYLIALIIFIIWVAILQVGKRLKFWEKIHCQVYGKIFLMVKTVKGRDFIDRVARRKRFWTTYGRISVIVTIGSMLTLTSILIWEFFLVFSLPPEAAPSPELILGLPGINPVIPLWYGILGLVVAIVVHEVAHGILSRTASIKVESLGLLFLVVPMGAFVEPNEAEIQKTTGKNRARLFAAGPATNILVAFICFLLLFLVFAPAVQPVSPGAIVRGVVSDSPADRFGVPVSSEMISINGSQVISATDLSNVTFNQPGDPVSVGILYDGEHSVVQVPGGIVVASIASGAPAKSVGIVPGMIVESLDDEVINSRQEWISVVENTTHSAPVNISVLSYGFDASQGKYWFIRNPSVTSITLVSKYDFFQQNDPANNKESYRGQSFIGITSSVFGVTVIDSDMISSTYSEPFKGDLFIASFRLIAFPFIGLSPIEGPLSHLYEPTGALDWMPVDVYWVFMNSLYWIFWLNLMVGLTNALPAVPLDGGFVFRDLLKGVFERSNAKRKKLGELTGKKLITDADVERYISFISLSLSLLVLFLIVWQIIGPRVL